MDTAQILFGIDLTPRVVAVETTDREVISFAREIDDRVSVTRKPFFPWILTDSELNVALPSAKAIALDDGQLNLLHEFQSWGDALNARTRLRELRLPYLAYGSSVKGELVRSGVTLFKGMQMNDTVRMQVDIETEGLNAADPDCRLLVIAVGDNRGLLDTLIGDEKELLQQFVMLVHERNPDIIEGHNILRFDLPFLVERARRCGVPLTLGRDHSEIRFGGNRSLAVGGTERPFKPAYIHGRHVIDTYLAVQRFDVARGQLTSYGLKDVARALGIAAEDRVELPGAEIGRLFKTDRARVLEYARQDIEETARLAEIVSVTEFYQAQMVPDSYGASATTGTGEKINSILIRAYLSQGCGIPLPGPGEPFPGGYTDVRETGVIRRVVKADVESLYPSIMLSRSIRPANDTLGVFLPALKELTARRLEAKANMASCAQEQKLYWDGLQGSFKILINSFYGYLAATPFHFNDGIAAAEVTHEGRRIVKRVADELAATGSRVIEIDTDGVYFVPPDSIEGEAAEQSYVEAVGGVLPQGIRLAFDGRFQAMISLKTKNYVLQTYAGKLRFTGASLRSRADERYGRDFVEKAASLVLEGNADGASELYKQTADDIRNGRVPLKDLARRERITEKTRTSDAKKRSRALAVGMAVGDFIWVYERRGGSLGRVEDYQANGCDENREYYMDKLHKFAYRLREAFAERFDSLFPRPSGLDLPVQETLDLFG